MIVSNERVIKFTLISKRIDINLVFENNQCRTTLILLKVSTNRDNNISAKYALAQKNKPSKSIRELLSWKQDVSMTDNSKLKNVSKPLKNLFIISIGDKFLLKKKLTSCFLESQNYSSVKILYFVEAFTWSWKKW